MIENNKTPEQTADNIKKNLLSLYENKAEYYAILFLTRKILNIKTILSFKSLLSWWKEALSKANNVVSYGVTIKDLTITGLEFLRAIDKAKRYFVITSGLEQLEADEQSFNPEKVMISTPENFKRFIDGLTEDEKKELSKSLLFNYDEAVAKLGTYKAMNTTPVTDMYEIPSIINQYDEPLPYNWKQMTIKEQVDWEVKHDILLKEFISAK